MAVASNRLVQVSFSGDIEYTQEFSAAANNIGQIQTAYLTSGDNTIDVPINAVAVTILPPAANLVALVLKGVNGDTGIALSLTDPTSIGLESVSSFVLNVDGDVAVRLIYN